MNLSLSEYRALPHAQRSLANWRLLSDADRSEYLAVGGADAAVNQPVVTDTASAAIDPVVAATIERMNANYKLATEEAPQDAAVKAAIEQIRANHEAASGFKRTRRAVR